MCIWPVNLNLEAANPRAAYARSRSDGQVPDWDWGPASCLHTLQASVRCHLPRLARRFYCVHPVSNLHPRLAGIRARFPGGFTGGPAPLHATDTGRVLRGEESRDAGRTLLLVEIPLEWTRYMSATCTTVFATSWT